MKKNWEISIKMFNQNEEKLRKIYPNIQSKQRKIEKDLSKCSIKTKKNWKKIYLNAQSKRKKIEKYLSKCLIKTKKNWERSIQMFNQNEEKLKKIYPNVQS
jgi:hypothetical protein